MYVNNTSQTNTSIASYPTRTMPTFADVSQLNNNTATLYSINMRPNITNINCIGGLPLPKL